MKNTYRIPKDVKEMTEKFKIDKGGICGQSCLAFIQGITIKKVFEGWEGLGMEFKGWSGWRQLREYLERSGYFVKQLRKNDLKYEKSKFYILRIQWIGDKENKEKPFYGYGHWSEASAHTHFIVVHDGEFFCNEDGLFPIGELDRYLSYDLNDKAVITSAMVVDFLLKEDA